MMHKTIRQQIGPYTLEQESGPGIIGVTYRATSQGEAVAIKLVHEIHLTTLHVQEAMRTEVQRLAALRHQSIAGLHHADKDSGQLYLVSDWVNGESLVTVMTRQRLSLKQIGQIGQQMAQGLSYAHRQGVVHGGLHPGNVLLVNGRSPSPQIKLTDFLLASLLPGDPPSGLLPYLAPEQVANRRTNARSDIYSMGVILYQLTTGQRPFQPQTVAEASKPTGEAISPQTLRPDVPPAFANLLLKATARPIRDRYRSMEEFLAALNQIMDQLPDNLTPAAAVPPVPPVASAAPIASPPIPDTGQETIRITHADESPRQFAIGQKWLITIGGMAGNDLSLPKEGVSDKHARLERRADGRWVVVDMGSRRGTFLGSSRLLPDVAEEWRPGQRLKIGPYQLEWGGVAAAETQLPVYEPPAQTPEPAAPSATLQVRLLPATLQTAAGQPVNLVVEIENKMTETAVVRLATSGIPEAWVTVETNAIVAPPGHKVQVPLVVQPPRHHSAVAGQHTLDVIAKPEGTSGHTVTASGSLGLLPFNQPIVAIVPPSLRHKKPGDVQITNLGNVADSAVFKAIDVNEALHFDIPDAEASNIAPGETITRRLTVTAKKQRAWLWETTVVPFEAQVQTDQRVVTLPAQVIVPPRLPTFLVGLLAVALLVLAGYFASATWCQSETGALLMRLGAGSWPRFCHQMTVLFDPDVRARPDPPSTAVASASTPSATMRPTNTPVTPTSTPTPTMVPPRVINLGESVQGKPITAVAFGSGPQAIILVGGIHAGYAPSSVLLATEVIEHYQSHPEAVAAIPNNLTLYIVPILNPDNYANRGSRVNANNVNLNSNWACNWQSGAASGSTVLSEPENKALYNFIEEQEQKPVAALFWNFPVHERNQAVVSPGRCQADQESRSMQLARAYATPAGYEPVEADPNQQLNGDVTDSLADMGIPSVFVLLDDANVADLEAHLAAITAVLMLYANEPSE